MSAPYVNHVIVVFFKDPVQDFAVELVRHRTVTLRVESCGQCHSQTTTPTATFRARGLGPTVRVQRGTSTHTHLKIATSAVVAHSRVSASMEATSSSTMSPGHERHFLDSHRLFNITALSVRLSAHQLLLCDFIQCRHCTTPNPFKCHQNVHVLSVFVNNAVILSSLI